VDWREGYLVRFMRCPENEQGHPDELRRDE
jgi:hypothetical protein